MNGLEVDPGPLYFRNQFYLLVHLIQAGLEGQDHVAGASLGAAD